MKKKHLDFILKFQKTTSRHLYSLRNSGIITIIDLETKE